MATYTVHPNQNIFDISLQLYGTIEGIFDLLITNTWLDMDTDLTVGQELEYHEDFILNSTVATSLSEDNIVPANGERRVYYKQPKEELLVVSDVDKDLCFAGFVVGGEGTMIIDWGDNAELEYIQLAHEKQTVEHYFDNIVDKRRIKIYGGEDMKLTYWDTTNFNGVLKPMWLITVDEYVSHSNSHSLEGLFLFEGTYRVDLRYSIISNLLPLGDMYLQELNLAESQFTNVNVVDEYLQYIVNNYGTRGACKVLLDVIPSETGMDAIKTILSDEEWNTPTPWSFVIKGVEYTYPITS